MRIEANKYVSFEYTLSLDSGEVVDKSDGSEPLGFIYGTGTVIDGLERALLGLEPGASRKISLEPEEAYGPVRAELVQKLPRRHFPPDVAVGATYEAEGGHGPALLVVREVNGDEVLVDMNHPLAGKRLHFDVHVTEVRDPTEGELEAMTHDCSCGCEGEGEDGCGCDCEDDEHEGGCHGGGCSCG